jgi:predicted site-specific integrase-resolvase
MSAAVAKPIVVGYARVSTVGQDLQTQRAVLLELGVDESRIYSDTGFSGKTMTRHGLEQALAAVREGDRFHRAPARPARAERGGGVGGDAHPHRAWRDLPERVTGV